MAILKEYNIYPGTPVQIRLYEGEPVNNWEHIDTNILYHNSTIETSIANEMGEFTVGETYEFIYEVFDWESCNVWLSSGNRSGTIHSENGIYSEIFKIESEDHKIISFGSNGILKIRNLQFRKRGFETAPLNFNDKKLFEDKSWTISYDLKNRSWIGWHSYLPNYYIGTPNNLYSYSNQAPKNALYKHHEGAFGNFYGTQYTHIIEIVSISNPILVRTWEDITLQINVKKYDDQIGDYVSIHDTPFDKVVLYNSRQSSGLINLIPKEDNSDYLSEQITDSEDNMIINNVEGNWRFNNFRDNVIDYTKPLFTTTWDSIQNEYPIDKVINQSVIDYLKDWYELESFRDKYLVIRLIYSNFVQKNNYQITTNYSITNEENSIK